MADPVEQETLHEAEKIPKAPERLKFYNTAATNIEVGKSTNSQASPYPSSSANTPRLRFARTSVPYTSFEKPGFLEIPSSVEDGQRFFAPTTARVDPSFQYFGDTVQETLRIFDIIRTNLRNYGQNLTDISSISVVLRNESQLDQIEDVLNLLFKNHQPKLSHSYSNSLPDSCSVEVAASAPLTEEQMRTMTPVFSPLQTHKYSSDQNNMNATFEDFSRQRTFYSQHAFSNMEISPGRSPNAFGDIIPPILAHAFGYYGEAWERIKATVKVLTFVRGVIWVLSPAPYVFIFSSSAFSSTLLEDIKPTLTFCVFVAVFITLHSTLTFFYGLAWIYYNAQCIEPGKLFNSGVPRIMITYFGWYASLCCRGDMILVLLLVSSVSALSAVIGLIDGEPIVQVKDQLIRTAVFLAIQFPLHEISHSLSKRLLLLFRTVSYQLLISNDDSDTIDESQPEGQTNNSNSADLSAARSTPPLHGQEHPKNSAFTFNLPHTPRIGQGTFAQSHLRNMNPGATAPLQHRNIQRASTSSKSGGGSLTESPPLNEKSQFSRSMESLSKS